MIATFPRWFITLGLALGSFAAAQAPVRPAPAPPDRSREPEQEARTPDGTKPEKPLISDLTDPMRLLRPPSNPQPDSAESVLRLAPGLGGDVLAGLAESEADLSSDLRMLLAFTRSAASQARNRAAAAPAHADTFFPMISTQGVPAWSEREQRDAFGRITSMRDAAGNRLHFQYDAHGYAGVEAEPIGPLNPRGREAGRALARNPARGFFTQRPIFDYRPFAFRAGVGARLGGSPLSNTTTSLLNPAGGRTFTTYDLRGRPIYTYDSRGRLSFNRYGPHGRLIGSYDARGRLTLYNHDALGRRNFAVDGQGNRMLVDHDRAGSAVLRTKDGRVIRAGGAYGRLRPAFELAAGTTAGKKKASKTPAGKNKKNEP